MVKSIHRRNSTELVDRRKAAVAGGLVLGALAVSSYLLLRKPPPPAVGAPPPEEFLPAPVIPIPPAATGLARFDLILVSQAGFAHDFEVYAYDIMGNLLANVDYTIQINGISQYVSSTGANGIGQFTLELPVQAGFTIDVVAGSVISNPVSIFT